MAMIRYAKGPVVYLYDAKNLKTKKKELLWGDWLRIGADINSQWSEVMWGKGMAVFSPFRKLALGKKS